MPTLEGYTNPAGHSKYEPEASPKKRISKKTRFFGNSTLRPTTESPARIEDVVGIQVVFTSPFRDPQMTRFMKLSSLKLEFERLQLVTPTY